MKRSLSKVVVVAMALVLAAWAPAATPVEIKLKDGTTWRGQLSDVVQLRYLQRGVEVPVEGQVVKIEPLYIVVNATNAGAAKQQTIFRGDIVSMKTTSAGAGSTGPTPDRPAIPGTKDTPKPGAPSGPVEAPPTDASGKPLGVFVLPLSGTVGEGLRHDEIDAVAREADKYGPGQIIVLIIESGGGLMLETEQIHATLESVKKRHRVVAWIKEAISAACATAMHCNEIYMTTTGAIGAMTAFSGTTSLQGEKLHKWMETAGDWMEAGGRSRYIAYAMIDDAALCSYDKNRVTGEVTWHNDLSGEFVLSDAKTNLVFTASTAMESKFADGVADTDEELAKLLNLPKWYVISDCGRKIAAEWQQTVTKAKEQIQLLNARLGYAGAGSGDATVRLGKRIQIVEELIRWWEKCPNVCFLSGVPPKEELERLLVQWKKDLADMKKRR